MTEFKKQNQMLLELLNRQDGEVLYNLADIETNRTWDYSMPTLTRRSRFTPRNTYASDEAFFETLGKINGGFVLDVLSEIGALQENNDVILYGGSLLDIILKRDEQIHDFDLRLIGSRYIEEKDACVTKAKEVVALVFGLIHKKNEEAKASTVDEDGNVDFVERHSKTFNISDVIVARKQSTVTIEIPMARYYQTNGTAIVKFQLTFSPYATVPDLLASCHPHCSRLALVDNRIRLTEMAKYCIQSLCVVLDKQSLTMYEVESGGEVESEKAGGRDLSIAMRRVGNYFMEKGFDVILPDLDISKVPTRNLKFNVPEVLDLPSLTIVFNAIEHNKIMVQSLDLPGKGGSLCSSYNGYSSQSSFNVGNSIHHNIRCLVSDVYDKFEFVAQGEVYGHIFDFAPLVTVRMISKSYETVKSSLTPQSIALDKVISYFSATMPEQVMAVLVNEPLRKKALHGGSLPEPFTFDEKTMQEIIDKEVAAVTEKAENVRQKMRSIGGLDSIVVSHPKSVTTAAEIGEALYGSYLKT